MAEAVADAPQLIAEEKPSVPVNAETLASEKETNGASKRGREEEEEESNDEILKKPKVDDESKEEAEVEMEEVKPVSAKLGPKEFESGEGMFNYFVKFLHNWPPNIDINKYEYMVLLELLKKGHAEPDKKIGGGIQAFQVRYHPMWKSRCFFLVRVDGTSDDFSFRKCVDQILPLPENMKVPSSNRNKSNDSKKFGGHHKGGWGGGHGGRGGRGRGGRDQRFGVSDRIATMRFKKGSVVEVLSRKEVASGSWFRAEIVSGNGHYYNVKYDNCLPDGGCVMGKVQRKDIRPCPPEMAGSMGWVPGDVVEVLENNSWKAAKMVKSLDGGNCYVVTPVGSTGELMLHKSNVRLRQFWKGDRWVLFDMEAENLNQGKLEMPFDGGKVNHRRLQRCTDTKNHKGDDKCDDERYQISLRGLKKRPLGAVKKDGKRRRLRAAHSSELPAKGQSWRPAKLASVGPRYCSSLGRDSESTNTRSSIEQLVGGVEMAAFEVHIDELNMC